MTSHSGSLVCRPVDGFFLWKVFDGYVKGATYRLSLKVKSRWCQWQLGTQCADEGREQSRGLVLSGVDPLNSRLDTVNLYSGSDMISLVFIMNPSRGGDNYAKES